MLFQANSADQEIDLSLMTGAGRRLTRYLRTVASFIYDADDMKHRFLSTGKWIIALWIVVAAGFIGWIAGPILFRDNGRDSVVQPTSGEITADTLTDGTFFIPDSAAWRTHRARSHSPSLISPIVFSAPEKFLHGDIFSVTKIGVTVHNALFAASEFADCLSFSEEVGNDAFTTAPVRVVIGGTVATACRNSLPFVRGSRLNTLHFYAFPYQSHLATFTATFEQPHCKKIIRAYRESRSTHAGLIAACQDIERFDPDMYFRSVVQTLSEESPEHGG